MATGNDRRRATIAVGELRTQQAATALALAPCLALGFALSSSSSGMSTRAAPGSPC
jgi:hypothetical protein